MNALLALVRKDLFLYFSDWRALAITLAAPVLIAAFFGAVMGGAPKKPSRVPIALVTLDNGEVAARLVAGIFADTSFAVTQTDEASAVKLVREGKVRAAAVIPAGFSDAAPKAMFSPRAQKPEITVHYDPSQAMALQMVKGLLTEHVMKAVGNAAFGPQSAKTMGSIREEIGKASGIPEGERRDLMALLENVEKLQARRNSDTAAGGGSDGFSAPFTMSSLEVTTGERKKYNAYAHSFAGMAVQFVLFMGIELGVAVLMMRRMGLWKRLRAAPVSRTLLIGSRVVSGTLIGLALLGGIYAAGMAVFGVRIEGSVPGFALIAIAFALLTATFGLLIAALGRTPEVARGIAILVTLLLVMLGGAWVPAFVFPEWLQTATLVTPTRWAVDGFEAMTWRGLGLEAAWAPVGVMLAFSAVFTLVAVKRFNWEE